MLELLRVAIALIGSSVIAAWDLKTSDIIDKLAIAMVIIGVLLNGADSMLTGDLQPFMLSLTVLGAYGLFGIIAYATGAWGAGDSVMLLAIGALVPTAPFAPLFAGQAILPFSFSYFINVFLVGSIYSVVYIMALGFRNRKIMRDFRRSVRNDYFSLGAAFLSAVFLFAVFAYQEVAVFLVLSAILAAMPVLYRYTKAVDANFYRRIPASKLKANDVIGQDLPKLGIYKKMIRGLTDKEVAAIKRSQKMVLIREGIRYTPTFPIALLFTLAFGDFLFFL